jgi:uncharacterized protein
MNLDAVFETSRTLPHPPAAVYRAFASPEVLAAWWGPNGFTNSFEVFESGRSRSRRPHRAADTTLSAAPAHSANSPSTQEFAMTTHRNALNWFEIPVRDIARAQAFYETLLATSMRRETIGPNELALFAYEAPGAGGCLMAGATAPSPSTSGTLVYLDAGPSLDAVLARVEPAGGRIATPKVQLPGDMGVFAHVFDTDGNRVGLHAPV